jgi:hypothetical protein
VSEPAYAGLRPSKSGPRWVLVITSLLLLGASVTMLVRDARQRGEWAGVARRYDGARRFPAALETANVIDESGEAGIVLAEALAGAPLGGDAKAAPDSVSGAQGLVLGVVERRPGSVFARLSLGRAAALTGPTLGWARPMELATAAAPGLDLAWSEFGSRYLATWGSLSPEDRGRAEGVLRRAFASPDFLRAALPTAVETLGPDRAVRTLPADSSILRRAAQILQESGNERAATLVETRLNEQGAGTGS